MAKPYYILVSRNWQSQYDSTWTLEFGDYDKEAVKFEEQDYKDHGCKAKNLKVIKLPDSKQYTVNEAIAALNGHNPDIGFIRD